jgi:hypothetical protein
MARMAMPRAIALALLMTCFASLPWAAAQESAKQSEAQLTPADSYKMEFTVNEMESGKKINSRSYLMLIRAEALPKWTDMKQLRMGSKVPYDTGPNMYQFEDVGMNIDCRLLPMGSGKVAIGTNWEYSSIGSDQEVNHDTHRPAIRHVSSHVEAVVPLDKPTVIAEMDDVASTHRYVFEVKVTKITP